MNIHDEKSLILVDNISKYYGTFKALDSVRFTVKAGERVAVAGPSGSGKSSLLNSLAGIIHPEKGRVLVDGNDLAKLRSRKEMCIGEPIWKIRQTPSTSHRGRAPD